MHSLVKPIIVILNIASLSDAHKFLHVILLHITTELSVNGYCELYPTIYIMLCFIGLQPKFSVAFKMKSGKVGPQV